MCLLCDRVLSRCVLCTNCMLSFTWYDLVRYRNNRHAKEVEQSWLYRDGEHSLLDCDHGVNMEWYQIIVLQRKTNDSWRRIIKRRTDKHTQTQDQDAIIRCSHPTHSTPVNTQPIHRSPHQLNVPPSSVSSPTNAFSPALCDPQVVGYDPFSRTKRHPRDATQILKCRTVNFLVVKVLAAPPLPSSLHDCPHRAKRSL